MHMRVGHVVAQTQTRSYRLFRCTVYIYITWCGGGHLETVLIDGQYADGQLADGRGALIVRIVARNNAD